MSENGDAMAVWMESKGRRDSAPLMTMAARYDAAAGAWGTPAILSNSASTDFSQLATCRIASDGQGNYLAVWNQLDSSASGERLGEPLRGGKWLAGAAGSSRPLVGIPIPLRGHGLRSDRGCEQGGRRVVIYVGLRRPVDVKVNRLTDFAANTWSGAIIAEDLPVSIFAGSIQVGMAANGDFLLTFEQSVAPYDLYYRHYDWATGWSGPESAVESPGKQGGQQLAMNEAGAAIVSWRQSGPGRGPGVGTAQAGPQTRKW